MEGHENSAVLAKNEARKHIYSDAITLTGMCKEKV